jgi:hypothetical protein
MVYQGNARKYGCPIIFSDSSGFLIQLNLSYCKIIEKLSMEIRRFAGKRQSRNSRWTKSPRPAGGG